MNESDRIAVSVLVPARDEADNIKTLVEKVDRAFAALDVRGELVLVDDGSTDGTWAVADALRTQHPSLRPIRHKRNMGLTAALRTGFRAVRGDVILFLPAVFREKFLCLQLRQEPKGILLAKTAADLKS